MPIFDYVFFPWSNFTSTTIAFFLPLTTAIAAPYFWYRAKLTRKNNNKFRSFILTSIHDDRYDELVRIIGKNRDSLEKVLEPDTLDLLFEDKFVRAVNHSNNWFHLRLLSNLELVKKLPDRFRSSDIVFRDLINKPNSLLQSYVAHSYGGRERPFITDDEWYLIESTLQNPEWYMSVRADYPLILSACETVASGNLDVTYNRNDELYVRRQGESSRIKCPIFLALKTHVLMLKEAIKINKDEDYYISDLWNLFHAVVEHSIYDKHVWKNPYTSGIGEYPTPFTFLMKEILSDLHRLCEDLFNQGKNPPGRIGSELVGIWSVCIVWLSRSQNKVSDEILYSCIKDFLDYTMSLKQAFADFKEKQKKTNSKVWSELFVDKLEHECRGDAIVKDKILLALNNSDYAKRYMFYLDMTYTEWLRNRLSIPDRPTK